MALFNKLFFSSSKKKSNSNISQNKLSPHFPFDSNQIRILLYRECDANGRRLLFDSNSIQKVVIKENQKLNIKSNIQTNKTLKNSNQKTKNESFQNDGNFIEIFNGIGYKHTRPSGSDITNIGEMVFGALAMSFRSPSLKVHWLQTPSRLLCSQVFLSPVPGNNIGGLLNQSDLLGSISNCNSKQKFKQDSNESFDGYSVSSLNSPFSPIETNNSNLSVQFTKFNKSPLNLQSNDQIGISDKTTSQSIDKLTPTISSDSGYTTVSDCWTSRSSYQYSTRSSMGSVLSDPLSTCDSLRKLSSDSNCGDFGPTNLRSTSFSLSMQQNSKSSDMSISKRILRNMQTSFENRNSICDFVGFISDNVTVNRGSDGCVAAKYNKNKTNESHSNPEISKNGNIRCSNSSSIFNLLALSNKNSSRNNRINSKRSKLGLAVCISMTESHKKEMEEFCCDHIALLESMLSRLRASAEYAYLNHKKFLKIMLHAWLKTIEWILDFFTIPRLTNPIWHNLTSGDNKSPKQVADNFVKEICFLLKTSDSKDTNFFISTMITVVLTHHLGWVSTVASNSSVSKLNVKMESVFQNATSNKQDNLENAAQKYPYNPLWAQMCDIYGAIGSPPKVSRTIISGKDKNFMEKCLNVLTYFIRCGEIHQHNFKINSIDQISIEKETKPQLGSVKAEKKPGLFKTCTFAANLFDISTDNNKLEKGNRTTTTSDKSNILPVYDLKYVKKVSFDNIEKDHYDFIRKKSESKENIKLTVTTPEDVEMILDDKTFSAYSKSTNIAEDFEALEAIEIQNSSDLNLIDSMFEAPNNKEKLNFWTLEPTIKEGLSWADFAKLKEDVKLKSKQKEKIIIKTDSILESSGFEKVSKQYQEQKMNLSTVITENSVDKSEHFVLGIEPVKKNICLEEEKHFEVSQKLLEKDFNIISSKNDIVNQEKGKGVVFVLGDNEHLINIKKSNENISPEPESKMRLKIENHNKKYSDIKFDLEKYSNTRMLNKKLNYGIQKYTLKRNEKSLNYDFWTKCTCDSNTNISNPSLSSFDLNKNKSETDLKNQKTSLYSCEFCTTTGKELQINNKKLHSSQNDVEIKNDFSEVKSSSAAVDLRKNFENLTTQKLKLKDENISCLAINRISNLKAKTKKLENLNLKILPMPKIENSNENLIVSSGNSSEKNNNHKTGFISSLFLGINDHYVSDMVLQGTVSPFDKWETSIKNDLIIASHCAAFVSQPTENVAIIADIDKWEIKIVSSQNNTILPCTSSTNGPVGMSQLVSQLLEGLYIMSNTGISSYECLEYIELKLKEIYLQSETLAELLLTTEFCSLNSITTALNLTENDVPLLLAIASIHSPQVTKRYGISYG